MYSIAIHSPVHFHTVIHYINNVDLCLLRTEIDLLNPSLQRTFSTPSKYTFLHCDATFYADCNTFLFKPTLRVGPKSAACLETALFHTALTSGPAVDRVQGVQGVQGVQEGCSLRSIFSLLTNIGVKEDVRIKKNLLLADMSTTFIYENKTSINKIPC